MDNKVFNVNGESKEKLIKTMELAFGRETAKSWFFDKEKGLIFYWLLSGRENKSSTDFPSPLDAIRAADTAWDWLQGKEAGSMSCDGWDANADHDGDNGKGFRVYCEDWGHVGDNVYAIIAVRPAYMWYGK